MSELLILNDMDKMSRQMKAFCYAIYAESVSGFVIYAKHAFN